VTHLKKMVLEELQRLNYAQHTTRSYIRTVEDFARYFNLPTGSFGPAAYSRIPSSAVSETEVVSGQRRCPSGRLKVLLLQDAQASLEHRRHSLSKKEPSAANDPQPGRSGATHSAMFFSFSAVPSTIRRCILCPSAPASRHLKHHTSGPRFLRSTVTLPSCIASPPFGCTTETGSYANGSDQIRVGW